MLLVVPFIICHLLIFPYEEKLRAKPFVTIIIIIFLLLTASILILKGKEHIRTFNLQNYVVTCSMYHEEKDFDKWWEKNKHKYANITKEEFKKFPFPDGISKFNFYVEEAKPKEIKVGDVISYYSVFSNKNVGHRVIKKWEENGSYFLNVLGDDNNYVETINGSRVNGKLIEVKLLSLLGREGCK